MLGFDKTASTADFNSIHERLKDDTMGDHMGQKKETKTCTESVICYTLFKLSTRTS